MDPISMDIDTLIQESMNVVFFHRQIICPFSLFFVYQYPDCVIVSLYVNVDLYVCVPDPIVNVDVGQSISN